MLKVHGFDVVGQMALATKFGFTFLALETFGASMLLPDVPKKVARKCEALAAYVTLQLLIASLSSGLLFDVHSQDGLEIIEVTFGACFFRSVAFEF